MGLVSQSIKNLKGGISQQPDILRFSNQGEYQENGWSSETEGLQKRPPTTFIKRLGDIGLYGAKPLIHLVNRDKAEQYYMIFTGTEVKVVDLQGRTYQVRNYNGYANCNNPRDDLRLITVADYTFVANRTRKVEMNSTVTQAGYPALSSRAIVNVRGGQYGRTLTVTVNAEVVATVQMPTGASVADVTQTDAQVIANNIASQINAKPNWKAEAGPGWVLIEPKVPTVAIPEFNT